MFNEELHNLYSSPNIIRMIRSRNMRWSGYVAQIGEKRNACGVLLGKPEGKSSLRRPGLIWEDNIKMNYTEIGLRVCIGFIYLRIGTSGRLL
jgi:hypothetical protein